MKVKDINQQKLCSIIETFAIERDWDQFHSIKNLVMALNVEAAELLEIFQWLSEEKSNEVPSNLKLKEKVEEELADIFIYMLRIIQKSNIDIESAVLNKLERNAKKYPVELSKGNAKKYDEF